MDAHRAPPPPLPAPLAPSTAPALTATPFPQLTRARSDASSLWEGSAPATDAYDLPESATMARLQRTPSHASARRVSGGGAGASGSYAGGAGLGQNRSRRGPVVVGGQDGRVEEGAEAEAEGVVEEEVAVGEDGEAVEETVDHAQRMYDRFSARRKSMIVAIVSFSALLAPFASSSFLPSIPQICEDLNTTPTIVNATVAIYIAVIGFVPLAWSPYAGLYGRRPIYVLSLPIFVLGSMGVALSQTLAQLIVTRIIQGIGSCSVLSVGAGTIGDLYPREQRGAAMGSFYLGVLVGPATAPAIAGILTEYAHPSGQGWRAMQWLLMAMGVLASLLVVLFFPETAHARGIDLVRQERLAKRAEKAGVEVEVQDERERAARESMGKVRRWYCDLTWVWLNPASPLKLLLQPNIAAMSLNSAFVLMSTYTVLVPLSQTVAPRYNISNAALLGCFYLAQGLGNAVSSRYTGLYADWELARWSKKRGGVYVAEDRLKATLWGGGLVLPGSVLALGWVLDRVGGKVGLAWTVILLFIDGVGLMFVLTPSNTYVVDCAGLRASEAIAVNNACRYALSAAASAFVLPMIEAIGVGYTNTFSAIFCWIGFGIVVFTIRYGTKMRELGSKWSDEGGGKVADEKVKDSGASGASTVVEAEGRGKEGLGKASELSDAEKEA
ncbi:hypothetical protein JCM10213_000786 [Rhodosporidiobolus nylandii]